MIAQIEFHPLFWQDVENHARYLEAQAALGTAFLDSVESAIDAVRNGPLMWACLYGNTRHFILFRFRQHIIHYEYFPKENIVRFYGLFHGSEDPAKWGERI